VKRRAFVHPSPFSKKSIDGDERDSGCAAHRKPRRVGELTGSESSGTGRPTPSCRTVSRARLPSTAARDLPDPFCDRRGAYSHLGQWSSCRNDAATFQLRCSRARHRTRAASPVLNLAGRSNSFVPRIGKRPWDSSSSSRARSRACMGPATSPSAVASTGGGNSADPEMAEPPSRSGRGRWAFMTESAFAVYTHNGGVDAESDDVSTNCFIVASAEVIHRNSDSQAFFRLPAVGRRRRASLASSCATTPPYEAA